MEYFYHYRSINAWCYEKTFYKIILNSFIAHIVWCKKFFHLDFNNPAVNTLFTPTKIFLQSRFINGWYIGKIFCYFILSFSCVHHLNTREYFYVEILSILRVQHLNLQKNFTRKNNPTKIELFLKYIQVFDLYDTLFIINVIK